MEINQRVRYISNSGETLSGIIDEIVPYPDKLNIVYIKPNDNLRSIVCRVENWDKLEVIS